MRSRIVLLLALFLVSSSLAFAQTTGTIKGRIRLTGKLPGNPVIRMGKDPMCAKINAGKQVVQETFAADINGGLANVFVKLQGTFPQSPVPAQPVVIDQRACIYGPRVVGARVGQTLQIRNSDPLLHNVHSVSAKGNTFNVGQPTAGLTFSFKLKDEEMLRLACDVHSWMTAYVGVVNHPYYAVSSAGGTFEIGKVPPGTYMIQAWHEQFGQVTKTVAVTAGGTAMVDFMYTGTENTKARGR